ncbi:MAG: selenocysteine-specific translation elongation factor [Chloroflexi bacterium]|nr:selenocysteine-specific translation elongation factor [Chloroflexota bacterium]
MRVVGTAGHVDHGKSTLIQALTGIDPDRLQEEKARGMTIDLGFAWLTLPSGQEVSIVDVPGHERFIHNMLAGVGGIDIALLMVAADEGVMPQTREHLDILDLLQIPAGLIVLTKSDLVDEEWLELVTVEIEEAVAGTVMAGAPIVPVSSVTGAGLPDLLALLDALLAQERSRPLTGRPRLPIDRVFTIAGFGTVVTGTLLDGELTLGQEVEIQPSGRKARIRGLQSHRRKVERATAGARVAVNLAGVATDELRRGEVIVAPGTMKPTRLIDVRLRVLEDAPRPLTHNMPLTFHTGAAETTAKASLLDRQQIEPGETAWAQLRLTDDVALAKGDLFIVRAPSPSATLGGGTVIEPHPRRHRRHQPAVLDRLAVLERGSPDEIVLEQLRLREPVDFQTLAGRTGLSTDETRAVVGSLVEAGGILALVANEAGSRLLPSTLLVSRPGWQRLAEAALGHLQAFHTATPLRRGMPKEELRMRLGLDGRAFGRVAARLLAEEAVREVGPLLAHPTHEVRLTPEMQTRVERLLGELRAAGATPPGRQELEARHGLSPDVLAVLIERGEVVEIAPDLVYPRDVLDEIVASVVAAIQQSGTITVAGLRDLIGASRKYALALLTHLDEKRITRRVGDDRVLF